jgi:hypothetical protein
MENPIKNFLPLYESNAMGALKDLVWCIDDDLPEHTINRAMTIAVDCVSRLREIEES